MNPYAFLAKLAGIGLVAGTAVAMVKLVEKLWPKTGESDSTFEYIAVAGEFPPEAEEACAEGCAAEADAADNTADCAAAAETPDTAENAAGHAAGTDAKAKADDHSAEVNAAASMDGAAVPAEEPVVPAEAPAPAATAPDLPNENPVDAPPAVPVTDPLKIADPADFQDWDELGCQG